MNLQRLRNNYAWCLLTCLLTILPSLPLQAKTFDDAVADVYKAKPYLYAAHQDDCRNDVRKKTVPTDKQSQEQEQASITWQHLENGIDIVALLHASWRIKNIYQDIYGSPVKPTLYEKNSVTRFLDFLTLQCMPTWVTNANQHRQFCAQTTMTLIEVYLYRTLARYTLIGIRYGVVQPIAWMIRGIQAMSR